MRGGAPAVMMLVMGIALVLGTGIYAQVKKDAKTGLDRMEGSILSINKDKSTLNVAQGGDARTTWKVKYNDQTQFTLNYKPSKQDDLRNGQRITVLGKFEKNVLTAVRIDLLDVRMLK